ncbi:MAG: radical SAM protein, partial [Methanobacterium sp.]
MIIRETEAKTILSKTGIPNADYVINPYVGCIHSCIFCYARFMKRFTGHKEEWGDFVDVKINAPDLIPVNSSKYEGKYILLSSVTDPYLPLERKYK